MSLWQNSAMFCHWLRDFLPCWHYWRHWHWRWWGCAAAIVAARVEMSNEWWVNDNGRHSSTCTIWACCCCCCRYDKIGKNGENSPISPIFEGNGDENDENDWRICHFSPFEAAGYTRNWISPDCILEQKFLQVNLNRVRDGFEKRVKVLPTHCFFAGCATRG